MTAPVRFPTLNEAAPLFGYPTGAAMLKAFRRGHLAAACLVKVGSRGLRVDVERLADALRQRPVVDELNGVSRG